MYIDLCNIAYRIDHVQFKYQYKVLHLSMRKSWNDRDGKGQRGDKDGIVLKHGSHWKYFRKENTKSEMGRGFKPLENGILTNPFCILLMWLV